MLDRAGELAALLAPYADSDPRQVGRFLDVPSAVAERALQLLLPAQRTARPNAAQPPMSWLVEQAREFDGRLVGSLATGRAYARIDGVQVPAAAARNLAERVAAGWPQTADEPAALPAAVAEAWPGWSRGEEPAWAGRGTDLLTGELPPDCAVVGLWWD